MFGGNHGFYTLYKIVNKKHTCIDRYIIDIDMYIDIYIYTYIHVNYIYTSINIYIYSACIYIYMFPDAFPLNKVYHRGYKAGVSSRKW